MRRPKKVLGCIYRVPSYSLETGSLAEPLKLTPLAKLVGLQAPRIDMSLPPALGVQAHVALPYFYVNAGDSNPVLFMLAWCAISLHVRGYSKETTGKGSPLEGRLCEQER